jgi:hypothetical protein
MIRVFIVSCAFSGKHQGLKIVRWLQRRRIDELRLQHFEKDALVLVITAIGNRPAETPAAARGMNW